MSRWDEVCQILDDFSSVHTSLCHLLLLQERIVLRSYFEKGQMREASGIELSAAVVDVSGPSMGI